MIGMLFIKNYGFFISNILFIIFILGVTKSNMVYTLPITLMSLIFCCLFYFIDDFNTELISNYKFITMLLIAIVLVNKMVCDRHQDELNINYNCFTIPPLISKQKN